MKDSSKRITLKSLIEKEEELINSKDYKGALSNANLIVSKFPKNAYGYKSLLKIKTNNFEKYVNQEELKEIKKYYEMAFNLSKKNDKVHLKESFDSYLYDLKEVDNLNKIKKEIISKEILKKIDNDSLALINQDLNTISSYDLSGKKIKNIYDFINGIILISFLIYNIFNPNFLLIITIPFGIFGLITIYSFIDSNLISNRKNNKSRTFNDMVNISKQNLDMLKEDIKKNEDMILFYKNQKLNSISKIPESFKSDISYLTIDNEQMEANLIIDSLTRLDVVKFSYLLESKSSLKTEEINLKINSLKDVSNKLTLFINDKQIKKKSNINEALLMKDVKPINLVALVITLLISLTSSVVIFTNFFEVNIRALLISLLVGIITSFIYNVDTGKHKSLSEMFSDNLLSTIFNATIMYDLIYYKLYNQLSITYGFLQIPITICLILIGYVMLISLLKYKHLLKHLRS